MTKKTVDFHRTNIRKNEECSECVWLPMCAGGCPHHRLYDHKACIGLRNEPEKYVLALHARIGGGKAAGCSAPAT